MKKIAGLINGLICLTTLMASPSKHLEVIRLNQPLKVDGVLDEAIYKTATPAADFLQLQPYNGQPAVQPTRVWVFCDEQAIYIGADLTDSRPDSIFNQFTERDKTGTSDYFGVYIDPYEQGQLAYGFYLTAAGVQVDLKAVRTSDGDMEYDSWDAVWESKTRTTDHGWLLEMRIPFSALRFSEKAGSNWGINFYRNIRRYNSNNSWQLVDRTVSGFIHQQGQLQGMKNLKPPMRLSLTPYLAAYANYNARNSAYQYKGGLDMKYGLNESFTLDMMLIPDFGQVQSDDQELNLTPYETYFSEKRPFFTEGMELFDRGGIFYSRRIGARPHQAPEDFLQSNEVVSKRPTEMQLVNATKVSGRTAGGWGLGMLNALQLPAFATLRDTMNGSTREVRLQPMTNQNVAVVDKTLPNNSFVSLINTNQTMFGSNFRSNATAAEFVLKNKSLSWALTGRGVATLRGDSSLEKGCAASLGLDKTKGAFRCGVSQSYADNNLNYNDMGYMKRNNECVSESYFSYQKVQPFGIFRDARGSVSFHYSSMVEPFAYSTLRMRSSLSANFLNNWFVYTGFGAEAASHDYYETRTPGRYYCLPAGHWLDVGVNSDWRKAFSVSFFGGANQRAVKENAGWYVNVEETLRMGRHLRLNAETSWSCQNNEHGFYDFSGDAVVFSKRDVRTLSNVLEMTYVINDRSSVNVRTRHYWSSARNEAYEQLVDRGALSPLLNFNGEDQNYNNLTLDAYFRWIFAPGSELVLAWKTAGQASSPVVLEQFKENWSACFKNQTSNLSLKVLYYLDYNTIRNLFKS